MVESQAVEGMTKPFDLLREVSRFGAEQGLSLNDPTMAAAFGLHVDAAMRRAMSDPKLLQGLRVEAMFQNLVQSFGEVTLIKPEDSGPLRTTEPMRAPDFRVILRDGSNWLVEVKNIYLHDAFRQRRRVLGRDYRLSLANYARATGGTLKLAVFWARWSIWTLVDPEQLAPGDQGLTLDMMTAVKANEMAAVGDQTLGLQAPMTLRLTMDPERTSDIAADGTVHVTIGKAQMFCNGKELIHLSDQQIGWTVMHYSDWENPDARAITEGNRLVAIEFESAPREPSAEGLDLVGSLSRMFARFYAEQTIADGKVINITVPLQDQWFGALRAQEGFGRMPLWRFLQQPNYEGFLAREGGMVRTASLPPRA